MESVQQLPPTWQTNLKVEIKSEQFHESNLVTSSVPVKLITYPGPGPLSDDIQNLDIGNIANETERAKTIQFSSPYCNIQVGHLF